MPAGARAGRVLIGKTGLDGHETGAKLVAAILRDEGYEVIYTGPQQTPETIVAAAIQEDVRLIGLSLLSGTHRRVAGRVLALLAEADADIPILLGGVIPPQDVPLLRDMGVRGVFGPGSNTREIVETVDRLVGRAGESR